MRVHLRQESEVSEKATPAPAKKGGRDVHIRSKNPARLMQGRGRSHSRRSLAGSKRWDGNRG